MVIYLYNLKGKKNKVEKQLTADDVILSSNRFVFKNTTSVLNPVIEIRVDDNITKDIRKATYAITTEHTITKDIIVQNRYFVEDCIYKTNNVFVLKLHLDVLSQYKTEILDMVRNGNMICIRSGTINSAPEQVLEDSNVAIGARSTEDQSIIRFGNVLTWDNPYYVLTVAGSYGVFHDTAANSLESEVDNNENS